MTIVQRVEPQIFHMPTKTRKLHAHIDPRNGNPTNLLVIFITHLQHRLGRLIYVIQIKIRCGIVKVLVRCFSSGESGKARTITMSREISSILDGDLKLIKVLWIRS
jgi:hypothetical protein